MVQQPQSWTIHEYATPGGEKPVLSFLQGLEGRNKRDAIALIQLLRERGNQLLDGMVKKQDEIPDEVLKRVRGYRQAVEAAGKESAQGP